MIASTEECSAHIPSARVSHDLNCVRTALDFPAVYCLMHCIAWVVLLAPFFASLTLRRAPYLRFSLRRHIRMSLSKSECDLFKAQRISTTASKTHCSKSAQQISGIDRANVRLLLFLAQLPLSAGVSSGFSHHSESIQGYHRKNHSVSCVLGNIRSAVSNRDALLVLLKQKVNIVMLTEIG